MNGNCRTQENPLRGFLHKSLPALLLWTCLGCLLPGCQILLTDDGEVGFKQSTSWGFYHTAKKTDATATSETKPMSLEAWFASEKAGMTPATPEQ